MGISTPNIGQIVAKETWEMFNILLTFSAFAVSGLAGFHLILNSGLHYQIDAPRWPLQHGRAPPCLDGT